MRTQSHGHDPTYDIHVLTPPHHLPPPLASVLQATLSLPRHIIEMTGQQCEGGGGANRGAKRHCDAEKYDRHRSN